MADSKYCSTKFKCGEDLDAALDAALCAADNARRAEEAASSVENTKTEIGALLSSYINDIDTLIGGGA